MLKFIVRRIFWTIPVLLVVIFLTFMMMRQIGGNPFRHSERAVPEAVQRNLERKFNLDEPWWQAVPYYVKGVFTFDFGPSLVLRGRRCQRHHQGRTSRSRSSSASTPSSSRSSSACR